MPSWNEVLKEIQDQLTRDPQKDPFVVIRQKYLNQLFEKRKRNIIAYYSGWL